MKFITLGSPAEEMHYQRGKSLFPLHKLSGNSRSRLFLTFASLSGIRSAERKCSSSRAIKWLRNILPAYLRHVLIAAITFGLIVPAARAQQVGATPTRRITQQVDSSGLVRLPGSGSPSWAKLHNLGRTDPNLVLHLSLALKSSAAQESAFHDLLRRQYSQGSSEYHHWLTPAEFGKTYGVGQDDLDTIVEWLQRQGFTIDSIGTGHKSIQFSASALQIENVFRTELHNYSLNGTRFHAPDGDISIPSALLSVVTGINGLDTYSQHLDVTQGIFNDIVPGDFAKIYDTVPLLSGSKTSDGTPVDGNGVTIGIVGTSDVIVQHDPNVEMFRGIFLPTYNADNINVISENVTGCPIANDASGYAINKVNFDGEAFLDVEWAGAVAPRATIAYVPSSDPVCAARYLVNQNIAAVISMSIGTCEARLSATDAFEVEGLWEQAAAQGITVVVSSGDYGSADCDSDPTESVSQYGFQVNGFASTPYNVAIGGTEFDEGTSSDYWDPSNPGVSTPDMPFTSAKGYIPEKVWNDSGSDFLGFLNLLCQGKWCAGGGGVSRIYCQPDWQPPSITLQSSDPIPIDPLFGQTCLGNHRFLPDLSFSASGHDGYEICTAKNPCSAPQNGGQFGGGTQDSGTSAAAPAFAGIQALLDQAYGRQGQSNYVLYALAAQPGAMCDSHQTAWAASCIFHDVVSADNNMVTNGVPCLVGTTDPDCPSSGMLAEFPTLPQYDLATGLGSVDVTRLYQKWNNARTATVTTLTVSPSTATVNDTITLTATVSPTDGASSNPASGTVAFRLYGGYQLVSGISAEAQLGTVDGVQEAVLAFSADTLNPGLGEPTAVYAVYSGDSAHMGSMSAQEPLEITGAQVPVFTGLAPSQSIPAGTTSLQLGGKLSAGASAPIGSTVTISVASASATALGL